MSKTQKVFSIGCGIMILGAFLIRFDPIGLVIAGIGVFIIIVAPLLADF